MTQQEFALRHRCLKVLQAKHHTISCRRARKSVYLGVACLARSPQTVVDALDRTRASGYPPPSAPCLAFFPLQPEEADRTDNADVVESVDTADFNWSAPVETRGVEPLKVGERFGVVCLHTNDTMPIPSQAGAGTFASLGRCRD